MSNANSPASKPIPSVKAQTLPSKVWSVTSAGLAPAPELVAAARVLVLGRSEPVDAVEPPHLRSREREAVADG